MDWDVIKLNWKRIGPLNEWSLSDAELAQAAGDRNALDKVIAAKHGITVQEARHQTQEWALGLAADPSDAKPVKPVAPAKPTHV